MSSAQLIRVTEQGKTRTVSFSSEHFNRVETARQIGWQLTAIMEQSESEKDSRSRLNLDFKDVRSITSVGLNELIGINSQARNQGVRVVLVDVPKPVREVFAVTRLERMFEFSST